MAGCLLLLLQAPMLRVQPLTTACVGRAVLCCTVSACCTAAPLPHLCSILKYEDWVWSLVARGGLLLVASGPEVHVHDLPTGKLVRKVGKGCHRQQMVQARARSIARQACVWPLWQPAPPQRMRVQPSRSRANPCHCLCSCLQFQNLHEGSVSCLEGTHSGRLLFSGGADGLLMAHDLRMKDPSRVLYHHAGALTGLALEDPWLVSAAAGVQLPRPAHACVDACVHANAWRASACAGSHAVLTPSSCCLCCRLHVA